MSTFTFVSTVTHRSLMNKSKDDLARWVLHLLDCRDEDERRRVQRVTDLLEANNTYQHLARDAREALKRREADTAKREAIAGRREAEGARSEVSAAVRVTDAIGVVDTLIESLAEGMMTDAGLTKADRVGMKHQITALEIAKDGISALTTELAAPLEDHEPSGQKPGHQSRTKSESAPADAQAGETSPDATSPTSPQEAEAVAWCDMSNAPKDGTMVRLLVRPGSALEDGWTPFTDSSDPYSTIGFNALSDTGEDEWQFAGWDWCHDCFTDGAGTVIGWAPFDARPFKAREASHDVE